MKRSIIIVIRTRIPLFKSKPGRLLLVVAVLALAVTVWLPVSPLAGVLSLTIAHRKLVLSLLLLAYGLMAELLKRWFFGSFRAAPLNPGV